MTKKCELCGTPVKVVGHTTKHYEPIGIVFPKEKFIEDGAYSVNEGSINYKMGYNNALKEVKRLNKESQPLVKLNYESVFEKILRGISKAHKGDCPQIVKNDSVCWECLASSISNEICQTLATKSEPVKMTVEELAKLMVETSFRDRNIKFCNLSQELKKDWTDYAQAIHNALYGGGE